MPYLRTRPNAPAAASALAALALVLTAAGCNATNSNTASGPSAAATSAVPANVPSTPAQADTTAGSSASQGCPVDTATLLAALSLNTQLEGELAQPVQLLTPDCYDGYAIARTAPKPGLDAPTVLFHFAVATSTWRAVDLGTADFCRGHVPAAVAAHLTGCA
jgi:hypothetical protein